MSELGGLIRKELGRIKSDKRSLMLMFAIPLILIIIFGLTSGGGPQSFFDVAVITRDGIETTDFTPGNSSIYDELMFDIFENNVTSFGVHNFFNSTNETEFETQKQICFNLLKSEKIDAYIILPENFSETISNQSNTLLIYYIDGSDTMAIQAIELALQEPIAMFKIMSDTMANFTTMLPSLEYDVPFWKSQILNYALAMILPIIIIGLDMNMSSLSIVSEGPLPRMLLTPTGKRDIILSKLISYSIIMILQITEIFVVTAFFGMYVSGSLFDFYLILLIIGFCGICMGLFISAVSKTEQIANQMYIMLFIVVIMFSGVFFQTSSPLMETFSGFLPLGHSIILLTEISLMGKSIDGGHLLSLIGISVFFLLLSYLIYRFKTKISKLEV